MWLCVRGWACVCVDLHQQWHRRVEHGWKPSSSSSLPLPAASASLGSVSASASGSAVGRVQFAAILKIVHQNPQSNLLRCFMTVLRAADFTPLKTTAQPTHNTLTHTQNAHINTRNTHFTCKSCINFCRNNTHNNKVTHCRVAHWSCGLAGSSSSNGKCAKQGGEKGCYSIMQLETSWEWDGERGSKN